VCRQDDLFEVLQTGPYSLLINRFDGGPAPYHFVFQGDAVK
jgi:hypothetical protein